MSSNLKQLYEHPLIGKHYLELIPATDKKNNPQKRCVECTKVGKHKESRYQCKDCQNHPRLCPALCFEIHYS